MSDQKIDETRTGGHVVQRVEEERKNKIQVEEIVQSERMTATGERGVNNEVSKLFLFYVNIHYIRER